MDETKPDSGLNTWAIVEVMGHSVYAGLVTEQTVASQSFIRIDVPAVDQQSAFTKLLGAGSIFSITPCDELIAREMVEARRTTLPVSVLCLPNQVSEQLRLGQQVMEAQKETNVVPTASDRDARRICPVCYALDCRESHSEIDFGDDDDDCEADDAA